MNTTRFNPTSNGDASKGILHLGHLYMCMVNEYMAHSTGGKFIVRFDDTQQYWINELGREQIARNCQKIIDELTWFGIKVDEYVWQSKRESQFIHLLSHGARLDDSLLNEDATKYVQPILVRDDASQYPDAFYVIAETVWNDWKDHIDTLIIGDELLSRWSCYRLIAYLLNHNIPQIDTVIHLPRLRDGYELASVSKTEGNYRVQDYIDRGYTPKEIETILRYACLTDVHGDWDWRNVKQAPMLTPESPIFHYTRTQTVEFARG